MIVTPLLNPEIAKGILARIDQGFIPEADRPLIKAIFAEHLAILQALDEKTVTIKKLRKMLFGEKTEKAYNVLHYKPPKPEEPKGTPKGHGKNGALSYNVQKVTVSHTILKRGGTCPECERGRLYPCAVGVNIRVSGNPPYKCPYMGAGKVKMQFVWRDIHRFIARRGRAGKIRSISGGYGSHP